jgi:hypothetical protein
LKEALRERARDLGLRLSDEDLERLESMVADLREAADRLRDVAAEAADP